MYDTNNQVLGISSIALPALLATTGTKNIVIFVTIGLFSILTMFFILYKVRSIK